MAYIKCEEDAEGYHKNRHETIDYKISGLARNPTLHGHGRIGMNGIVLIQSHFGALWNVVAYHMRLEVDVVIQFPDMSIK